LRESSLTSLPNPPIPLLDAMLGLRCLAGMSGSLDCLRRRLILLGGDTFGTADLYLSRDDVEAICRGDLGSSAKGVTDVDFEAAGGARCEGWRFNDGRRTMKPGRPCGVADEPEIDPVPVPD
jgi:hypothetical protein